MTIHYHGTPITPVSSLNELAGRHFCVSHAHPCDIRRAHEIGQSVMLDNGAFSKFKTGKPTNWGRYYEWCDEWLAFPSTWAVIPDVIDGLVTEQDMLLTKWPYKHRGAPVWHLNEPLERLMRLTEHFPKVCFGSTAEYWEVLSPAWCNRVDDAFNMLAQRHRHFPWVHMLRGMKVVGHRWPFASVDSTDIARNHKTNRGRRTIQEMVDRWDRVQCPAWINRHALEYDL